MSRCYHTRAPRNGDIRLFHSVHAPAYIVLARQLRTADQDLSQSLTVLKLALDNLMTGGLRLLKVQG